MSETAFGDSLSKRIEPPIKSIKRILLNSDLLKNIPIKQRQKLISKFLSATLISAARTNIAQGNRNKISMENIAQRIAKNMLENYKFTQKVLQKVPKKRVPYRRNR